MSRHLWDENEGLFLDDSEAIKAQSQRAEEAEWKRIYHDFTREVKVKKPNKAVAARTGPRQVPPKSHETFSRQQSMDTVIRRNRTKNMEESRPIKKNHPAFDTASPSKRSKTSLKGTNKRVKDKGVMSPKQQRRNKKSYDLDDDTMIEQAIRKAAVDVKREVRKEEELNVQRSFKTQTSKSFKTRSSGQGSRNSYEGFSSSYFPKSFESIGTTSTRPPFKRDSLESLNQSFTVTGINDVGSPQSTAYSAGSDPTRSRQWKHIVRQEVEQHPYSMNVPERAGRKPERYARMSTVSSQNMTSASTVTANASTPTHSHSPPRKIVSFSEQPDKKSKQHGFFRSLIHRSPTPEEIEPARISSQSMTIKPSQPPVVRVDKSKSPPPRPQRKFSPPKEPTKLVPPPVKLKPKPQSPPASPQPETERSRTPRQDTDRFGRARSRPQPPAKSTTSSFWSGGLLGSSRPRVGAGRRAAKQARDETEKVNRAG